MPCAGSGSRAGGDLPKQYQLLHGLPMVCHTLRALAQTAGIAQVCVVIASDDAHMANVQQQHAHLWPAMSLQTPAIGGDSRAASVLAGLLHLRAKGVPDGDWVLVHDAARCLVTPEQITDLIHACQNDAVGGLLAVPLADTLKSAHLDRADQTLSRENKWLAQTPQMFRLGMLISALERAQATNFEGITDEASAMERMGHSVRLVPSSTHNFKVTYPQDWILAEALLQLRQTHQGKA